MNHDMFSQQVEQQRSFIADELRSAESGHYHSTVYKFREIEEIIQLSQRLPLPFLNTKLICYQHYYYLVVMFPEQRFLKSFDWLESLILEYGNRGNASIHRLLEYGKIILPQNAIASLQAYFK